MRFSCSIHTQHVRNEKESRVYSEASFPDFFVLFSSPLSLAESKRRMLSSLWFIALTLSLVLLMSWSRVDSLMVTVLVQ